MRIITALVFIICVISLKTSAQTSTKHLAFTVHENDLLPESVGYDAKTQSFYVGSTRKGKIIKIDSDGSQSVFVDSGKFGQWMIIGIKVDSERNELWFCSSGGGNLIGYKKKDDVEGRPAGVFKMDLTTGKLIKKYTLENEGEVHFFNDLVIDQNGDVYVTHMFGDHAIYKIDHDDDELDLFAKSDDIKYPNGITISDNRKLLFVAHSEGIARIDIAERNVVNLNIANDIQIKRRESIDGLYFYQNSLVGIQPGLHRITQLNLSQPMNAIIKEKELEIDHPLMDHPTTGVIVDDTFYYVANAQFEKVKSDGAIDETLSDPTILKIDLK